jgi:hypothetical protein
MDSGRVQVVILAEDVQHDVFLRRFLKAIGKADHRQIRTPPFPAGRGCGEQFVRRNYPIELREYRKRASRVALWFFLVTDADDHSVDQRRQKLSKSLVDAGINQLPTDREAIAILIPKRNIETWIKYLKGEAVDETTDYSPPKHEVKKDLVKPAADRLAAFYRAGWILPLDCPDSLRRSVNELKRVLAL